ncbi:MAG: hypothetical protein LUD47_00505 [Clostridia bacterium]|nr:hypothetical protein [Clostridia bacterium]
MNEILLRMKLVEKEKKYVDIAKLLNLEYQTLYYKIKHNSFTTEQATKISNFLELSEKERCDIFLPFD